MVFIYTFSSNIYGYGRYNRSKFLSKYLKEKNFTSIIKHNVNLKKVKIKNYAIYFFDLPFKADSILKKFYEKNKSIYLLDYYGNFTQAKNFLIYDHQKVLSYNKYVGIKYAIVNPYLKKLKRDRGQNRKILISIGGADVKNHTYKIAYSLHKLGYDLTIIYGPLAKNSQINFPRVQIYQNPKNFLELINSHKYIFCNGGSTLLECLYLNKKVFALPQNRYEFEFCKYMYENKFIFDYRRSKISKKNIINFIQFKTSRKLCINGLEELYKKILKKYEQKNKD